MSVQIETLKFWIIHVTEPYRSHIDTTATQALIDARNEIEKWADGHVEVCYVCYKHIMF